MFGYKINRASPDERTAAIYEFQAAAAGKRRIALRSARAVLELERTGAHYHRFLYEDGHLQITGPADAPTVTDANGRRLDERQPWKFGIDDPPPGVAPRPSASQPSASQPSASQPSASQPSALRPSALQPANRDPP